MAAIRPARRDELTQVLALWRAAGAQPTMTDDEAALAALLDHDPGSLLVAEEEGGIVGTLVVGWDGWRGTFYRLAVLPERRRAGVARALVAEGERRLEEAGARRLALFAVDSDPEAVPFWTAVGYRLQHDRSRLVKDLDPAPSGRG